MSDRRLDFPSHQIGCLVQVIRSIPRPVPYAGAREGFEDPRAVGKAAPSQAAGFYRPERTAVDARETREGLQERAADRAGAQGIATADLLKNPIRAHFMARLGGQPHQFPAVLVQKTRVR